MGNLTRMRLDKVIRQVYSSFYGDTDYLEQLCRHLSVELLEEEFEWKYGELIRGSYKGQNLPTVNFLDPKEVVYDNNIPRPVSNIPNLEWILWDAANVINQACWHCLLPLSYTPDEMGRMLCIFCYLAITLPDTKREGAELDRDWTLHVFRQDENNKELRLLPPHVYFHYSKQEYHALGPIPIYNYDTIVQAQDLSEAKRFHVISYKSRLSDDHQEELDQFF